jgi:chaperonin GroES
MSLGGGDALARGAARAQFGTADVSEQKWKEIFGEEGYRKLNAMDEKDRLALQEQALPLIEPDPEVGEVKFRAVQDRVIVRRVETETKTTSGLFLADESKEKPYEGIVVAVGPGRYTGTEFVKPTIEVGERVVFGKFSGAEVRVGIQDLLVLREEDIFLVKENGENPND